MAAFLRTYADFMGRPVMGEKTPAHLGYVDMLLEWFPGGKVVHIVRDPRAGLRLGLPPPPPAADRASWLMRMAAALRGDDSRADDPRWNSAARRHRDLERRHPTSYRMIRFEDLVRAPEETLPGLFDFLGVALPAGVTDVSVVSRGFMLGEAGLDAGAADRWREHIHPLAGRLLTLLLGRQMRRLGYADQRPLPGGGGCRLGDAFGLKPAFGVDCCPAAIASGGDRCR